MSGLLLTCLHEHAKFGGLVMAREEELLDHLSVGRDALVDELRALADEGAVTILSPLPYLVLKLKKWSGKSANAEDSRQSAYSYSKQLLQPKRLIDSNRREGVGEARSTGGALMAEILETLGETDATGFEKAIELYSPHVIRTALSRVARARGIRKSRTALFRHLLPRLARKPLTT